MNKYRKLNSYKKVSHGSYLGIEVKAIYMENKSMFTAKVAVFGAMAGMLSLIKAEIPFPLLPYLKFDLAEIPDVLAFMIMGPLGGIVTTAIHWLILTFRAGFILGPFMKYAAVSSMLLGFWGGIAIRRRLPGNASLKSFMIMGMLLGGVLRIITMSIANFLVLYVFFPEWMSFAKTCLQAIGLEASNDLSALLWTLLLTAVYNAIHIFVSVIPSYALIKSILKLRTTLGKAWIDEVR